MIVIDSGKNIILFDRWYLASTLKPFDALEKLVV
jgi:hypothetical protein